MDAHEKVELAAAHANGEAIGQVAVAGIAGICNELARLGALDEAAIRRIRDFMLQASERSGATAHLRSHLADAIGHHFDDLWGRVQRNPAAPHPMQ